MRDYKFSAFHRPSLKEVYFDLLDRYKTIILDIYAFDHGKYKVCSIKSTQFENGDMSSFVNENKRLKVSAILIAFGGVVVDCF